NRIADKVTADRRIPAVCAVAIERQVVQRGTIVQAEFADRTLARQRHRTGAKRGIPCFVVVEAVLHVSFELLTVEDLELDQMGVYAVPGSRYVLGVDDLPPFDRSDLRQLADAVSWEITLVAGREQPVPFGVVQKFFNLSRGWFLAEIKGIN